MTAHYKDQVDYSTDAVEAFLPAVWNKDYVLSARPKRAAANGLRAKGDPRHVPDWLLACADVQVGFARAGLDDAEKECLRNVYHLGYTPGELSAHWSVASETIQNACRTGIEKISEYLSGRTPR